MFEHSRAGDCALFRNVPHQNHRGAGLLGQPRECSGTFAHLYDGAGSRRKFFVEQGLNRIDNHDMWLRGLNFAQNGRQRRLGQHLNLRQVKAQSLATRGNLSGRLFAGNIQRSSRTRQRRNRLQG